MLYDQDMPITPESAFRQHLHSVLHNLVIVTTGHQLDQETVVALLQSRLVRIPQNQNRPRIPVVYQPRAMGFDELHQFSTIIYYLGQSGPTPHVAWVEVDNPSGQIQVMVAAVGLAPR